MPSEPERAWGPVPASPANRDYQAGFTAAMMLKDLKLAQEAARTAGVSTRPSLTVTQTRLAFGSGSLLQSLTQGEKTSAG